MTWPVTPGTHAVQLYEDETFLHRAVTAFMAEGARRGGPLVMVARRRTFEAVTSHVNSDRILFVDAEAALENILDGATVNAKTLEQAFVNLLATLEQREEPGTVWMYGERVDLFCQLGHHQTAVQVEQLWNQLIPRHRQIVTVCGYAIRHFDDHAHADPLRAVCAQHTDVIPTEHFVDAPDDRGRFERVVLLEQRARALERAVTSRPAPAPVPAPAPATTPAPSVTAPIYVVDDDASVRKALERLLLSMDLTVRSFPSAEELLAEVDGSSGGCLIVDVQLLGMSGTELQQRLAHARDRWPIIAMSGAYDAQIEHEALRQGAVAFLRKPFVAAALFDAIARATSSSTAPCRP